MTRTYPSRPACRTWDFHAKCWRVSSGGVVRVAFPPSGFRVVAEEAAIKWISEQYRSYGLPC